MSNNKSGALPEITCPYCKKQFVPKSKRQKFCNTSCGYAFSLAMQKTRMIKKECVICGKEFWGYGKSKTCSEDCRKQYISSKMRRLHDSRRNAGPKPMTTKKKRIAREREEYMQRVKASGMSYGQYRARNGIPFPVRKESIGTISASDYWMGGGEVQVGEQDHTAVQVHMRPGIRLPQAPEPTRDARRANEKREDRLYMAMMGIDQPEKEGGTPETKGEKNG